MAPHSIELPTESPAIRRAGRLRKLRKRPFKTARLHHDANISMDRQAFLERLHGELSARSSKPEITKRDDQGSAPLSLAQESLWLFQQLFPDNTVLNTFRTL